MDELLLRPTPPSDETLFSVPAEDIAEALGRLGRPEGFAVHGGQRLDRHGRILQLVRHLVGARGWPHDDVAVHEAIMDAMADPRGSAQGVRALLKAGSDGGTAPTEALLRSALAALSVHPDYALRHQVLGTMRAYWMKADDEGGPATHSVLAAMLREGQTEMAYDELMRLLEAGKRVELWLYDVFVVVLARDGHLDEMLDVLARRRAAKGSDPAMFSLACHALDVCSAASHMDGVVWAWAAVVGPSSSSSSSEPQPSDSISDSASTRYNPPDAVLENVLATAARHGHVGLATEAHAMLAARSSRPQAHHYEALVDAYVHDADVAGALRALARMQRVGFRVEREHTRSVYTLIRDSSRHARSSRFSSDDNSHADPAPAPVHDDLAELAETTVREMADEAPDGRVPPNIAAVVVEATAAGRSSEAAHALYTDYARLTGEQPPAMIIQDMILHGAVHARTRGYIDDFRRLVPNTVPVPRRSPPASSRLVAICLDYNHLDLAMVFAIRGVPSRKSIVAPSALYWLPTLAEMAIEAQDRRLWILEDKFLVAGNDAAVEVIQSTAKRMQAGPDADEDMAASQAHPMAAKAEHTAPKTEDIAPKTEDPFQDMAANRR